MRRLTQAHNSICFLEELFKSVRRSDRQGNENLPWRAMLQCAYCHFHCRPRRSAIVDEYCSLPSGRDGSAVASVRDATAIKFRSFLVHHRREIRILQPIDFNELPVQDDVGWIAVDDRGDCQFGIAGGADDEADEGPARDFDHHGAVRQVEHPGPVRSVGIQGEADLPGTRGSNTPLLAVLDADRSITSNMPSTDTVGYQKR